MERVKMPENLILHQPDDNRAVCIKETWEVEYWMKELHYTMKNLIREIHEAGLTAKNVRRWLDDKIYIEKLK